jgi:hypothetical protein
MAAASEWIARCRTLVDDIDVLARATGGYEAQQRWWADLGGPVYDPAKPLTARDVTSEFLARIPERAVVFSGSSPEGTTLNMAGRAVWRVLRGISPLAGAKLIDRWWHRLTVANRYCGLPHVIAELLSELQAERLPPHLWPVRNFDGNSHDRMALAERLRALHTAGVVDPLRCKPYPMVLEIGAGYGALALALKRALPHATYVIVDLPDTLKLSGAYLATRQDAPVLVASHPDALRTPASILLCPATAIERLEKLQIDLAINTLSFGEMAETEVDRYAVFLISNLRSGGVLFEQNFDNRRLGAENFCNPSAVLSRRFHRHRVVPGTYLKGIPRVWSA